MPRILIRSAKDPVQPVAPEACLAQGLLGTNAGNLVFGQAVHKVLTVPGTELVSDSYRTEKMRAGDETAGRINESFDVFVVPLANAFRPTYLPNLERLTGVIRRLDIPVVVVGVGAQLALDGTGAPPEMAGPVKDFVSAVLDRSASIGVRGEISAGYLRELGFGDEHVDVIGCPSLYNDPDLHIDPPTRQLTAESRISMNVTPAVPRIAPVVEHNTDAYPNLIFVPQHADRLALMLWGEEPESVPDPRMPVHTGHRLYREDRMRFFVDPRTWVDFLAEQEFSFGTRIHGNIVALLAGTPAFVLTFDSRTRELADYHAIPQRPIRSLPDGVDAADLLESADYTELNRAHPERLASYLAFLEKNGLDHTYRSGDGGLDFDRRLREADLPPAVQTLFASGEEGRAQVADRLRWLRQGRPGDRERRHYRYDAPFAPDERPVPTPTQRLSRELAEVRRSVNEHERRLNRHTRRLRRLGAAEEARRASSWRSRLARRFGRGR